MNYQKTRLGKLPIEWKRGQGLRKSDINKDGENKCVLYGELYTKHNKMKITYDDLSNTYAKSKVVSKKGDVLVPGTSTAKKTQMLLARQISADNVYLGGDINIIRPQTDLFADKYLPYYFQSKDAYEQLERYITGATGIIHISNKGLKELKVPIFDLSEQKQIVAILDKSFSAIDQAKVNIEKNIENSKELIESYLQKTFSSNVSGSVYESLNDICELIVDCEHKTAPTQETGYPSIRTPNIGFGELILKGVYRVSKEVYQQWTRRAIPKSGDLILAREAPAGNIAVIPENIEVCLGQRTVLIRPKKEKFIPRYLAYLILSKEVQKRLLSHSQGLTVGHINMRDIRSFKIFNLPTLAEQKVIVDNISSLLTKVNNANAGYSLKLSNVEELKKTILQKAFAGELTENAVVV